MSNYPHSAAIATSLSTSPYAVQTNLEALIHRSRTHPHAHRHENDDEYYEPDSAPSSQPPSRRASQRSQFRLFMTPSAPARSGAQGAGTGAGGRDEEGDGEHPLIFGDDEDDAAASSAAPRGIEAEYDDEDEDDVDERSKLVERKGRRMSSSRRSYGAVSAPLSGAASGGALEPNVRSGSSGTSRSRSKGRTPPRRVFRPLARHQEESLGRIATSTETMGEGEISPGTRVDLTDDAADYVGPMAPGLGRGRSAETRPMSRHSSPVSTTSALLPSGIRRLSMNGVSGGVYFADDDSGDEGGDVARGMAATGGAGLLGAGVGASAGMGRRGSGPAGGEEIIDPCDELCADDLEIPTGDDGQELRVWHQSLRAETPIVLRSSLPVFIAQISEWSLSLASVISIGHLGTADLAASSLANMTAAVSCYSILQGLATALDTLLPAAWTSSDPSRVGLWTQRMTVVMAVSTFPMFVLWWNIEGILLGLGQERDIAALAGVYLAWLSMGIPGYGGTVILKKYLQAQNLMHIPTYVMFVVAPTNLVLNYLLVWGPDSIRLGFIGGAVATATSYNLTFIMLLTYTMFIGPREAFHPLQFKYVFTKLGTVTSLGLAGTIMLSSEWWAWEACALAASLLGPTSLAAQSVLLSTCSTLYQLPNSLGVAAAVRVGNLLGAGRGWEAKWASRASFILGVIFACGNSAICLIFRKNWGYLFNNDPEVVQLVATIMPYIALFQVADGVIATANSVLRALGLHSTGALINLTCYYIIGLPFGLWLAFARLELGLAGIWIGLSIALIYASIVEFALVWRADWDRAVERVRERLGLPGHGHVGTDGKWHEGGEEEA